MTKFVTKSYQSCCYNWYDALNCNTSNESWTNLIFLEIKFFYRIGSSRFIVTMSKGKKKEKTLSSEKAWQRSTSNCNVQVKSNWSLKKYSPRIFVGDNYVPCYLNLIKCQNSVKKSHVLFECVILGFVHFILRGYLKLWIPRSGIWKNHLYCDSLVNDST